MSTTPVITTRVLLITNEACTRLHIRAGLDRYVIGQTIDCGESYTNLKDVHGDPVSGVVLRDEIEDWMSAATVKKLASVLG